MNTLNIRLTEELRRYVDDRASDSGVYATPSEYIRDLIRHDMEERAVIDHVAKGLDDLKQGRFSSRSISEVADETISNSETR